MKLVKSLLLGSAAGLCAVAGAQAADLPMRKAAPVEYVRVCTVHGAGFFYIPGSDTCIRIGGRARFEYQYTSQRSGRDVSGYRGLGRISVDTRTATPYGTLRAFVRIDIASRTGAYLKSGTQERYGNAFFATGQDTFARIQKFVELDRAFVQFAGIVAGRSQSVFDFYAADIELIGANTVSNAVTNLLSYTASFGGGFTASVSVEDPAFRRNPVFSTNIGAAAPIVGGLPLGNGAIVTGARAFAPVGYVPGPVAANGAPGAAFLVDVAQISRMPDFVTALRVDQAWGSAQVMGAVHEIALGNANSGVGAFATTGAPLPAGVFTAGRYDKTEYGFAVGGGIKLNLPQLAPGDTLWLQVAYAQGAGHYTGIYSPQGQELLSANFTGRSQFQGVDAALNLAGRLTLTESFSGNFAFLHYWSPEVRQGLFGSYARAHFDKSLRGPLSPVLNTFGAGNAGFFFNPAFKDYNLFYVGTNLVYSPVRDLDFGVEVVYERLDFLGGASRGRVADLNKFPNQATSQAGAQRVVSTDDNILVRLRVQRDF